MEVCRQPSRDNEENELKPSALKLFNEVEMEVEVEVEAEAEVEADRGSVRD
jgi:hypothetical protein